jgi:hypothetical protein
MEDSDEIRGMVDQRLKELRLEAAEVSRRIGKGRTYLHDYINKRSPKVMPDEQKLLLAPIIGLHPSQLGMVERPWHSTRPPTGGGMAEDVIPYVPGPNSLRPPPHLILYTLGSDHPLDAHPMHLTPGRVISINTNQCDPATIPPGAVVTAQVFERGKEPFGFKETVLRQFLPPDKLVTNSAVKRNEIVELDAPDSNLIYVIQGTMTHTVDDVLGNGNREFTVAITREDLERGR